MLSAIFSLWKQGFQNAYFVDIEVGMLVGHLSYSGWARACQVTALSLEKRKRIRLFLQMLATKAFLRTFLQFPSYCFSFLSVMEKYMAQSQFSGPFRRNISSPSETSNVYFPFVDCTNNKRGYQGRSSHPGLQWKADSSSRASEGNLPVFLIPTASLELNSW